MPTRQRRPRWVVAGSRRVRSVPVLTWVALPSEAGSPTSTLFRLLHAPASRARNQSTSAASEPRHLSSGRRIPTNARRRAREPQYEPPDCNAGPEEGRRAQRRRQSHRQPDGRRHGAPNPMSPDARTRPQDGAHEPSTHGRGALTTRSERQDEERRRAPTSSPARQSRESHEEARRRHRTDRRSGSDDQHDHDRAARGSKRTERWRRLTPVLSPANRTQRRRRTS